MAILVAGGAGYIGSHVCKLLHKRGYSVVVYDSLIHGYRSFAKWGEFIQGDIGDARTLSPVFERFKIDVVMHFCAFLEVAESVTEPEKYYKNNVQNTITLLEQMRKNGVDKFIFSSTAAVYGVPERIPIAEEDRKEPINPYGASKLMVERILEDYAHAYDFRSIRFRYFNAAGADPEAEIGEAHVPEPHLIPLILDAALGRRKNIKVFGTDYETKDGTCVRDYIHVNDLADAHIRGVDYLLEGGMTSYFNLGSGSGFTVREMLETVRRVTGRDFKVEETERRPGDPPYLIASSDKARNVLHWKPGYSLEDIVRTAWAWQKGLTDKKLA
jgi:UDP-glucose 4-epimerase